MAGNGNKEVLKGQIAKRLRVMMRSCFCIILFFISTSQRRQIKPTKGNGINDGCVRWLLCLCRSLLMAFVGCVRRAAAAIFAY